MTVIPEKRQTGKPVNDIKSPLRNTVSGQGFFCVAGSLRWSHRKTRSSGSSASLRSRTTPWTWDSQLMESILFSLWLDTLFIIIQINVLPTKAELVYQKKRNNTESGHVDPQNEMMRSFDIFPTLYWPPFPLGGGVKVG